MRTTGRALVASRSGLVGLVLVAVVVLAALVSLVWTPYDPTQVDASASWRGLSGAHWLGTDKLGRDIFSEVLAGARLTLAVAAGATALAAVLGPALALAATVSPRRLGGPVAHLIDVLIAFPILLVAMVLAAVYGGSTWTAIVAIGAGSGIYLARVLRAEIASVLGSDYVLAAHAYGAGTGRIVRRHVLPNVAPVLLVQLSLTLGLSALSEAALSYLGFGTPPPAPSWGRMLAEQQQYVTVHPLVLVWPGLAVVVAVLGFNLLGDGLREATDPRLRGAGPAGPAGGGTAPVTAAVAGPAAGPVGGPVGRAELADPT